MFGHATYLTESREAFGGENFMFTFPNGWGASVVSHAHSYGGREGLWELAVLRFGQKDPIGGDIHYQNSVAQGDVRGYLGSSEVSKLLSEVKVFDPVVKKVEAAYETAMNTPEDGGVAFTDHTD